MSYKVTTPDLRNSKSYVLFKKENEVWEITTPAPEEKRGAHTTVLLPNEFDPSKPDEMFESICSELKIIPGRVPGVIENKRDPGRVPGVSEVKRDPGRVPGVSEVKRVPGRVPGNNELKRVPGGVPGANELKRVPGGVPGINELKRVPGECLGPLN